MTLRRPQVKLCIACALAAFAMPLHASVVDDLLGRYRAQGAAAFDAAAAEAQWTRPSVDAATGETRRCSSCHTANLKSMGKHATTGKAIEPLAPSVNRERLTDIEKIEKWLLRNCKWTLGRECTPQEKGNFLVMIRTK
jgi:hypothetical protein